MGERPRALVVGAGISGVACARELAAAGVAVRVLDRGRRIGGRMASRRLDGRPVDLGASYLTASDEDFGAVVDGWRTRGLARPWTDAFTAIEVTDGRPGPGELKPGPVRWGAARGLRSLVEDLAEGLDVVRADLADADALSERIRAEGAEGPVAAVVLAMPDAQAYRLLPPDHPAVGRLQRPSDPILALAARWPWRTWDGVGATGRFDGAFVNGDDVLSFVADDGRRRGDAAPVLVAHSTPGFAASHVADPQRAAPELVGALRRVLDVGDPLVVHVRRWSLARPTGVRDDPFLLVDGAGTSLLGVCGDGWGGPPRVETAWRSGRDLGRALARRLAPALAPPLAPARPA